MKYRLRSAAKRRIEGQPAKRWLENHPDFTIIPREDGVIVKNICCPEMEALCHGNRGKNVPMATSVLLTPEGKFGIRIYGHLFQI